MDRSTRRRRAFARCAWLVVIAILAGGCVYFCGCRQEAAHEGHDHEHGGDAHAQAAAGGEHAAHGDADHADADHGHAEHGDAKHDHQGQGETEHVDEVRITAEAAERYGIRVEEAVRRKLTPRFVAPARVAFNAEAIAHIGSTLFGRVVELPIRLGDTVQPGDLLLVVESPQLGEAQSTYLQKLIAAETAGAAVDLAKSALDRAKRLYDENRGIALDAVQKRELEYQAAQAEARTAQAAAVAAENTLHVLGMTQAAVEALRTSSEVNPRFPIVAPIAGEIVEREVTLGELVSPEREKLLVVANVNTLWVLADVPEAHLAEIERGAKAWVRAGRLDPHAHEGQVSYVAPMVDPRTRTVSVRVAVECEDRALRPGMFVELEIASADRTHGGAAVLAVPQGAVQTVEGGPAVFVPVAGEANTFAKRSVRVGDAVAGLVPVLEGLAAGEAYVAAGSFLLKAELGKGSAEHHH
ncbi:MAG TPA: efflux RND transporter periplasmic adaptor subunit [Phycisphaerae bacterium]|nr:efflux RND transporter periplasmic adaptor subunit [Phycisphaerales bacterium]HRX84549.1 efflux RND transporter periplasmic adaptor subunit [Phycisphaerae bacterium]